MISDRADEVHGQRGGDFGNLRIFMADSGNFKNFVHMFFFFGDLVSHQGPVSERSEPKTAGNKQIQTFTLRCLGFSTVDDAFSAFLISPSMVLRV